MLVCGCAHEIGVKKIDMHFHMSYEMIFVKKGHITLEVNKKKYEVRENTLIILGALEEHTIENISNDYDRYYIHFAQKTVNRALDNPKLASIFKNRPVGFNHCMVAPNGTENAMKEIFAEVKKGDTFSDEIILCKLKELLISLYRERESSFPFPKNNIKKEIIQIQNYIEKHFMEELLISQIADKFFINKYYLAHSFKELTGYSPKQYLLLNRLSYAKELLISSKLDINEIAINSGFTDSNSFIRSFKNEYQTTPNKYRKNL